MGDEIYLDNNATTKPYPEVLEAMKPFYDRLYGNPSSVHQKGREAKAALDDARQTVARHLNARSPAEVVFVSCATEANTLALRGFLEDSGPDTPHVVSTRIEHPSVLNTLEHLEQTEAIEVDWVSPDQSGFVSPGDVESKLREDTELVSVMTANNEVGTLQPVDEISAICRDQNIVFHTDAVQAMGKIPLDVQDPEVDLLSLSAHKFHGPPGIGILYRRKEIDLAPQLRGGGQEGGVRSGTEAPPLAAGIAKAVELSAERQARTADKTTTLREKLLHGLRDVYGDDLHLLTPLENALPNTLNVSIPGSESDKFLMKLDLKNICVSAGSACHSGAIEVSHVLEAMDVPKKIAARSVRFSLSGMNDEEDIDETIRALRE